ncbi:MAG: nuclear transport factor 2 family protein [Chloroflexota bacterium]|nr:nuclear transport factor 2 family protein [Chloroflexota bacterium]
MSHPTDAETKILSLLNEWTAQHVERNIEQYMALFVPGDQTIYTGPESTERCIGANAIRQQAARDWQLTEYLRFDWQWHSVQVTGVIAWLVAEGVCRLKVNDHAMEDLVRFVAVVQHDDENWRFASAHLSVAIGTTMQ